MTFRDALAKVARELELVASQDRDAIHKYCKDRAFAEGMSIAEARRAIARSAHATARSLMTTALTIAQQLSDVKTEET